MRISTRILTIGVFIAAASDLSGAQAQTPLISAPSGTKTLAATLKVYAFPGAGQSAAQQSHPIIFLTGQADIQTSVQAMKMGAVDFLTKPFDDTRLLAAIDQAIRFDIAARGERGICETIQKRLLTLSRRERQVMELIILGRINREIGLDLGICEKTVKVHRMRVLKKLDVRSVADLVQLVARVGVESEFPDIDITASNSPKAASPAHSLLPSRLMPSAITLM